MAELIRTQHSAWAEAEQVAGEWPRDARYLIVGCGSSLYLAQVAAAIGERKGYTIRAAPAGDVALEPDRHLEDRDVLVVVSRSGTSTEAVWAADEARRRGVRVYAVTCQPASSLAGKADRTFAVSAGEDATVVMIRSFSSLLVLLQSALGVRSPNLGRNAPGVLDVTNQGIAGWTEVPRRAYLLGGGVRLGIVQEGALKIQEMSGCAAYGYPPLEFRHGPRGSVTPRDLIVLAGQTAFARYEYGVIEDLARQGPMLWVVAQRAWWKALGGAPVFHHRVVLPDDMEDVASGPLAAVPLQRIGWEMAVANGRDPDHPDNLEKVVAFRRE